MQELSADDLKMLDSDATSIGDENFKHKLANVAGTSSALAERQDHSVADCIFKNSPYKQGGEFMFRMRKRIFPEKDYEVSEHEYQIFISKNKEYIDDLFYDMFHYDYFHDGNFSDFDFDFYCRKLTIVVCCPNYLNDRDEYVNIDYRIMFSNVSYLDYRLDEQSNCNCNAQVLLNPIFFMHGEIGTLLSPRKKMSLIMQLHSSHARSPLWVSLIFDRVEISPVEPLAFEVLKRMDHLHLEEIGPVQ